MSNLEDITPGGSASPVYIDPTPLEPNGEVPDLDALLAANATLKATAMSKLMSGQPLTEDEARVMVGLN